MGWLIEPITQQTIETHEHTSSTGANRIKCVVSAMQGWSDTMEDEHICDFNVLNKNIHIFGVFDGHAGDWIAKWVKNHFIKELKPVNNINLQEHFLALDALMLEPQYKAEIFPLIGNMTYYLAHATGCTACVVMINEDDKTITCANAGDSRAIVCKNGVVYALSTDHSPFLEHEKQRIYKAGGHIMRGKKLYNVDDEIPAVKNVKIVPFLRCCMKHNDDDIPESKNVGVIRPLHVSRALGDFHYKQNKTLPATEQMVTAMPDICVVPLDSMDFIVIGCDGIWECKTSQEVADFIYKRLNSKTLEEIVQELLDECLCTSLTSNMNGYDNMTCMIIQLK